MWILPPLDSPNATQLPVHRSQFPFTHHRVGLSVFARRSDSPPGSSAALVPGRHARFHPDAITTSPRPPCDHGSNILFRLPTSRNVSASRQSRSVQMRSMTGYGRGEIDHGGAKFTVELNSVNRKQSDLVINLPRDLGGTGTAHPPVDQRKNFARANECFRCTPQQQTGRASSLSTRSWRVPTTMPCEFCRKS